MLNDDRVCPPRPPFRAAGRRSAQAGRLCYLFECKRKRRARSGAPYLCGRKASLRLFICVHLRLSAVVKSA
jgi:hypothetical protein